MLFSSENRLEEAHLLAIILDEDECSFVKEQVKNTFSFVFRISFILIQVCNVLINLSYSFIDDETKLATGVRILFLAFLLVFVYLLEFNCNSSGINIFSK
jgi:hypothetical protein